MENIHNYSTEITWRFLSNILSSDPRIKDMKISDFLSLFGGNVDLNIYPHYIFNNMFLISNLYSIILINHERKLDAELLDDLISKYIKVKVLPSGNKVEISRKIRNSIAHFKVSFSNDMMNVYFSDRDGFEAESDFNQIKKLINEFYDNLVA
ncbi:hypothetical protein ACT5DV_003558 [Vibrio cholerae]